MKIKVCGITRMQDAQACDFLGIDYLGFNFWQYSKRYITAENAKPIIASLKNAKPIGIFVEKDLEYIKRIVEQCALAGIQLHTEESISFCKEIKKLFPVCIIIQAFRVKDCLPENLNDFDADYFLFDTFSSTSMGGTGMTFDWNILELLKPLSNRTFIAGGINAENIEKLLSVIKPFAIDVASGVEISPGIKDIEKVKLLLSKVKKGKL